MAPANPLSIEAIAHRLRATRETTGLTQSQFADRAGIAQDTYNQWESAMGRPGLDEAMRLRAAYGVTLDWIYLGDASRLPRPPRSESHVPSILIARIQRPRRPASD
jgi:transcriptional regulator with XRE-family HTH domain